MIHVEKVAELSGHQNPIYTIENSFKPQSFLTAGNDKGVVEWSLETMSFVKVLMPVESSVYALHTLSHSPILAVGERSGRVNIYDFSAEKVTHILKRHQLPVFDICSIESKKELLVSSEDGTVSVWNTQDFSLLYQFPVSTQTVRTMAISPDGKTIAFGCKDNIIRIFNLEDYSSITELSGHTMPVTSLEFSPDGSKLLSGGRDAILNIWHTDDFSLCKSMTAHMFTIYGIKFHPTLPLFATASRDKSIKIWGAEDYKLYKIISRERGYESHTLSINKIIWAPDGEHLISVGDDKLVFVWKFQYDY